MILYSAEVDDELMNVCNIYCSMFHWFLMLFAILNIDTRILNSTESVFSVSRIILLLLLSSQMDLNTIGVCFTCYSNA